MIRFICIATNLTLYVTDRYREFHLRKLLADCGADKVRSAVWSWEMRTVNHMSYPFASKVTHSFAMRLEKRYDMWSSAPEIVK